MTMTTAPLYSIDVSMAELMCMYVHMIECTYNSFVGLFTFVGKIMSVISCFFFFGIFLSLLYGSSSSVSGK